MTTILKIALIAALVSSCQTTARTESTTSVAYSGVIENVQRDGHITDGAWRPISKPETFAQDDIE